MNLLESFLKEYKCLEEAARACGFNTIIDYEYSKHLETDSERRDILHLARIIRNYCQHHSDGQRLLDVKPALINKLLQEEAYLKGLLAKTEEFVIKVPCIKLPISTEEALKTLAKNPDVLFIPVVNAKKEVLGILTFKDILTGYKNHKETFTKVSIKASDITVYESNSNIANSESEYNCVCKNGKYIGVLPYLKG